MMEAQVRLQLRSEELEEITKGKVAKKVSMSTFLSMGLELEIDQYVIALNSILCFLPFVILIDVASCLTFILQT